ncbi:Lsr2 family protein [Kitasatospora purpeofusca]|uniref:Lsr2 family DNA-binding protein n=1 Tax=Kitasatospora purpeofusca TaxID=67352 RepID=UPI00224D4560|nr:histone-like nucleoid-structuring protein Lsr2 [Kitasatospora purpeofusca]MCX4684691.1 Lsr2 family protein [Kitasatospora purpeofusca]
MRTTVLIPVEKTFCDAHLAKNGSQEEATESLTIAGHAWDLCLEHGAVFARHLMDVLGVPGRSEAVPVAAEKSVTEAKHDHQDDTEDDVTEAEPVVRPTVLVSGEIPGYEWDDAREAVRNLGYEVVGRADANTVLIICGEGAERATKKLQDAVEFGIPCFDASKPGAFRDAVCAGEFKGGDPLPEPVRVDAQAVKAKSEAQAIRDWAKAQGYAVNAKGPIPASVRHAYRVATKQAA